MGLGLGFELAMGAMSGVWKAEWPGSTRGNRMRPRESGGSDALRAASPASSAASTLAPPSAMEGEA